MLRKETKQMRNSFLYPIPEIYRAVNLLDLAANALLKNDQELAASLLVKADMPEIKQFYRLIAGHTNPVIHWQSSQPKDVIPKDQRVEKRMPTNRTEQKIFDRDGWRCRYCGTKVISRVARKIFIERFPIETHWVSSEYERHSALHSQAASLDHVLPHSRGGTNNTTNLVTACGPCQFGRNQWTLEEVGFKDPRERSPILDDWDGLSRLEGLQTKKNFDG